MKNRKSRLSISSFLVVLLIVLGSYLGNDSFDFLIEESAPSQSQETQIEAEQAYTDPQEVVDYIEAYGGLPPNYITKEEAESRGWVPSEGNLQDVVPGMSIGGDYFGNFEGHLPEEPGRTYYEADVNYEGGHRGAERLVFSNDGFYFYTDDHYASFTQLE